MRTSFSEPGVSQSPPSVIYEDSLWNTRRSTVNIRDRARLSEEVPSVPDLPCRPQDAPLVPASYPKRSTIPPQPCHSVTTDANTTSPSDLCVLVCGGNLCVSISSNLDLNSFNATDRVCPFVDINERTRKLNAMKRLYCLDDFNL